MLSALEAVAPTTTVVDTFRERGTLSNLGSIDARIEKDEAKLMLQVPQLMRIKSLRLKPNMGPL